MILNKETNSVKTNYATRRFTMDNSGGHIFNAIAELYSRPQNAVIRELSTNCLDAHKMSQNYDKKFIITIPDVENGKFNLVFRDFGPGLTNDGIQNIYTVVGRSTKREQEDSTGCLGFGSKSPHSITESFTVNSYKDGYKSTYIMSKDHEGVPVCPEEPIMITETFEENGLEIIIPVHDKVDWVEIIKRELMFFSKKPIVKTYVPGSLEKYKEIQIDYNRNQICNYLLYKEMKIVDKTMVSKWTDSDNIRLYKQFRISSPILGRIFKGTTAPKIKAFCVMAEVGYPLDLDLLKQKFDQFLEYPDILGMKYATIDKPVLNIINILLNYGGFDIYVPGSSVFFAPSREALNYKTSTLNTIFRSLIKYAKLIHKLMLAKTESTYLNDKRSLQKYILLDSKQYLTTDLNTDYQNYYWELVNKELETNKNLYSLKKSIMNNTLFEGLEFYPKDCDFYPLKKFSINHQSDTLKVNTLINYNNFTQFPLIYRDAKISSKMQKYNSEYLKNQEVTNFGDVNITTNSIKLVYTPILDKKFYEIFETTLSKLKEVLCNNIKRIFDLEMVKDLNIYYGFIQNSIHNTNDKRIVFLHGSEKIKSNGFLLLEKDFDLIKPSSIVTYFDEKIKNKSKNFDYLLYLKNAYNTYNRLANKDLSEFGLFQEIFRDSKISKDLEKHIKQISSLKDYITRLVFDFDIIENLDNNSSTLNPKLSNNYYLAPQNFVLDEYLSDSKMYNRYQLLARVWEILLCNNFNYFKDFEDRELRLANEFNATDTLKKFDVAHGIKYISGLEIMEREIVLDTPVKTTRKKSKDFKLLDLSRENDFIPLPFDPSNSHGLFWKEYFYSYLEFTLNDYNIPEEVKFELYNLVVSEINWLAKVILVTSIPSTFVTKLLDFDFNGSKILFSPFLYTENKFIYKDKTYTIDDLIEISGLPKKCVSLNKYQERLIVNYNYLDLCKEQNDIRFIVDEKKYPNTFKGFINNFEVSKLKTVKLHKSMYSLHKNKKYVQSMDINFNVAEDSYYSVDFYYNLVRTNKYLDSELDFPYLKEVGILNKTDVIIYEIAQKDLPFLQTEDSDKSGNLTIALKKDFYSLQAEVIQNTHKLRPYLSTHFIESCSNSEVTSTNFIFNKYLHLVDYLMKSFGETEHKDKIYNYVEENKLLWDVEFYYNYQLLTNTKFRFIGKKLEFYYKTEIKASLNKIKEMGYTLGTPRLVKDHLKSSLEDETYLFKRFLKCEKGFYLFKGNDLYIDYLLNSEKLNEAKLRYMLEKTDNFEKFGWFHSKKKKVNHKLTILRKLLNNGRFLHSKTIEHLRGNSNIHEIINNKNKKD